MSIGTDTSTGPGPPCDRQVPRTSQRSCHLVRAPNAPSSLDEWLVDRELIGVAALVELLVRAASLVVGRDVTGDDEQRDRVERGGRDAGHGIRQAGADVEQDDAGPARGPGVAVRGVGRDLFVPGRDESRSPGALECREQR